MNDLQLDFDLHVHTFHSPCCEEEMLPEVILDTAARRGIRRLGLTDHFYPFTNPGIFDEIRRDCAKASVNGVPEVLFGCEAEIMAPGKTSVGPELAEKLDFVMVAATHFQNAGIVEPPPADDDESIARHYLEMLTYAVGLPYADTVAHPFFVVPGVFPETSVAVLRDSDILPTLELARENGVAMEISPRALFPAQLDFSLRFYRLCKKVGVKFTLGSDAHRLEAVGRLDVLRPIVHELRLSRKDFWLPTSEGE